MSTATSPEPEKVPAWNYPTKTFKGHTGSGRRVCSVACFKDGKHIITGSHDKTARIWNIENLQQVGESLMHDFEIEQVALSPDERTLLSSGDSGIVMWNLEGRAVMWKTERDRGQSGRRRVAYSPDGKLIAACYGAEIELLNAETGKRIRDPLRSDDSVWSLAFSSDGVRLAMGSWQAVRVIDVATGETSVGPFHAHGSFVNSLVFTIDGQQIVSTGTNIGVWDAASGQRQVKKPMEHQLLGRHKITQVSISPDGHRIASIAEDSRIRIWDLGTGQQIGATLQTIDVTARLFDSFSWSPNGRCIVAGDMEGKIHVWNVTVVDPAPAASSHPLVPSTSRSRANSLSSSILNLPARSQPPTSSRGLRNDFFDDTDSLPASARPQISAIPTIATAPIRLSMPRPTTVKTAPNNPLESAPAPGNIFGHLGSRFRRDKPALEAIEMQPPPFKTRAKSSVVGKVALAEADVRLYVAKSKKKKQKPDDLADVKVGCWDIFRTLIGTCCLLRKDPDLDSDSESTSSRRK